MAEEKRLSGTGTDKVLVENELLKVTNLYNDLKKHLEEDLHSIISDLGETDFKESDADAIKGNIKLFVADKKNREAISVQSTKFYELEEKLFVLNKQMKYLKRILNVLNHLDEFKLLEIVYNYHYTENDELYIFFTSTIKDKKAQVVYRSIFTQDVLELKTDFDGEGGGYNNDTYILPSGNMYSYKQFKHLEKERIATFSEFLTTAENEGYIDMVDYPEELRIVKEEEKVLETITEQDYKKCYTDLYLDFLLFTENYIK